MPARLITIFKWTLRGVGGLVFLLAAVIGFGITPTDADKIRRFDAAVRRWQVHPDFRAIPFEYADLGSAAMQTRICGISATRALIWFRSLPGLPESMAIAPTSQAHYDQFTRGPWAAYLHLADEQDLAMGLEIVRNLGSNPSDENVRALLRGFALPVPIATDDGAVASVRSLLADVDPAKPFAVHANDIRSLFSATTLAEADRYPPGHQMALLRQLDEQLRLRNPELWRTKQVNDFLSGIWGQGYGQIYATGIGAVLAARQVGRVICVATLVGLITRMMWKRNRRGWAANHAGSIEQKDQISA